MKGLILKWMFVIVASYVESEDKGLELSFQVVRPDNISRALSEFLILSNSSDRLDVICNIADGPEKRHVDAMSIYRLSGDVTFQTLATMQAYTSDGEGYREPYLISHDVPGMQATGTFNDDSPSLGVSIPGSRLTCAYSTMYKCSVLYSIKDGASVMSGTTSVTRNLTLSANPSNLTLTVTNTISMSTASVKDASYVYATVQKGDVITLTCKANLGTRTHAVIRWKKSTSFTDGSLLPYKPRETDHEEGSAKLISGSACLYEKTDTVRYRISDQDSARPLTHPLQFQCYVLVLSPFWETPEASRRNAFVSSHHTTEPGRTWTTTRNSSDRGPIHVQDGTSKKKVAISVGIVFGLLAALAAIVAVVFVMRKYKIRCIMMCEDRTKGNGNTCRGKATLNPVYSISSTSSSSSTASTETRNNYEELDNEGSTFPIYETLNEYHEIDDLE